MSLTVEQGLSQCRFARRCERHSHCHMLSQNEGTEQGQLKLGEYSWRELPSFTLPFPASHHVRTTVKEWRDQVGCILGSTNLLLIFFLCSSAYAAVMLNQFLYTLLVVSGLYFLCSSGRRPLFSQKVFVWSAIVSDTAGSVVVLIAGHEVLCQASLLIKKKTDRFS